MRRPGPAILATLLLATPLLAITTSEAGTADEPEVTDPEGDASEPKGQGAASFLDYNLCRITPVRETCWNERGRIDPAIGAARTATGTVGLPGPPSLDGLAAWFAETPETLFVTLELAGLDASFSGALDPDGKRTAVYKVSWTHPPDCEAGVRLEIAQGADEPFVNSHLWSTDVTCPREHGPDAGRAQYCTTWGECWWSVPYEIAFGGPATITWAVPREILAAGGAGATLSDPDFLIRIEDSGLAPGEDWSDATAEMPNAKVRSYFRNWLYYDVDASSPGRDFAFASREAPPSASAGPRFEWRDAAGELRAEAAEAEILGAAIEETPTRLTIEILLGRVVEDPARDRIFQGAYFFWAPPSGQIFDVDIWSEADGEWGAIATYHPRGGPGDLYERVLDLPVAIEVVPGSPGKFRFTFDRGDLGPIDAGDLLRGLVIEAYRWDDSPTDVHVPPNDFVHAQVKPPGIGGDPSDYTYAPPYRMLHATDPALFAGRGMFLDDVGDEELPREAVLGGADPAEFDITYLAARTTRAGEFELSMGIRDLGTLTVPPLHEAVFYAFGARTDAGDTMIGLYKRRDDPAGVFLCAPDVTVLAEDPTDPTTAIWTPISGRIRPAGGAGIITAIVPVDCVAGGAADGITLERLEAATFLVRNPTGADGQGEPRRTDAAAADGPVVLALAEPLAATSSPTLASVVLANPRGSFGAGALALVVLAGAVVLSQRRGVTLAAKEREGREAYRAALDRPVVAGAVDEPGTRSVLASLRAKYRISDREHAVLLAEIKAAHGLGASGIVVGGAFLGKYVIQRELGEGGFARTFLARDEKLGREVVLKVARWSNPEETKRALREARILAKLSHPNIVTVHDAEEVTGEVVLVLEYVQQGSLADRLGKGALALAPALALAQDVLAALEEAHSLGIVHRDVKPGNILVTKEGRAKLADFGIARPPKGAGTVTGPSMTDSGSGTLRYMAPEQARGLAADERSDLYSLGVVLYEMLTGRSYLPFDGLAEFEARRAILEEEPDLPIPGVPSQVNVALRRALAKDPAERPADAAELRRLLAS